MKTLILLAVMVVVTPMADAAQVRVVDSSSKTEAVEVSTDGQPTLVQLREIQVTLASSPVPGGKPEYLDVLMLREPKSGLFWWRFQTSQTDHPGGIIERFLRDSIAFLTGDRVVCFMFSTPNLWIGQSAERQPSMEAGQAGVLAALERDWEAMQAHPAPWFHRISLRPLLGKEFFVRAGSVSPFPGPKLREVSSRGGQWRVVLDGPNGDSAAVLLNEGFQLLPSRPAD